MSKFVVTVQGLPIVLCEVKREQLLRWRFYKKHIKGIPCYFAQDYVDGGFLFWPEPSEPSLIPECVE